MRTSAARARTRAHLPRVVAVLLGLAIAGLAGPLAALSPPVEPLPGPGSDLWEKVAAAPGPAGEKFDPVRLVAAANGLIALGSPYRAIDFLRAFRDHEVHARHEAGQIFLLLRAVFDVGSDATAFPPMLIGAPDWTPAPASAALLPRFPLALEGDLPLMLVSGYSLGGLAEDPATQLDWYEKHGRNRTTPLRPPDDPAAAVDAFIARVPELVAKDGAERRALLHVQVVRAVRAALPAADVTDAALAGLYPTKTSDGSAKWKALRTKIAAKARWDAAAGAYVRAP